MIRLEFQSMQQITHMYQAMMAGKFEGRDKSLLLSEPLAQALETLVEQLLADARSSHNEQMVSAMLDGLNLKDSYPQFDYIAQSFAQHHDEIDWTNLSEESQMSYLKTAAKPLSLDDNVMANLKQAILDHIEKS